MRRHRMLFTCIVTGAFIGILGILPGCPQSKDTFFTPLQEVLSGCNPATEGEIEEEEEESYIPEGPTEHWKSKETTGTLNRNRGIYLDIQMDAKGVFTGKIGNYVYESFPGFGSYYATYEDLKKGVCGKLDVAAGTGVVWPEEEEKTNVVVRLVDGPNLVVTFTEWPSLSADDPPGATLWKM